MNYIVIEAQTNGDTTAILAKTYAAYPVAEQAYHTVLAAAAVSSVHIHAASMLNEQGQLIKRECYAHEEAEE